jgi:hypothetical protein
MPNHITNVVTFEDNISKEQLREILETIKNDEIGIGSIDFNKLIPMPKELEIECGSQSSLGLKVFRDLRTMGYMGTAEDFLNNLDKAQNRGLAEILTKVHGEQVIENADILYLGEQAYNNLEKYGHTDWYNWSIEKWGTKWNSYGYDGFPPYQEGELSICFLTAWSRVDPIIIALSERFPDVGIGYMWADEDIGSNVGFAEYKGGECMEEYFPEQGSEEAIEMACKIKGIDSEEFFCEDESEVLE